MLQTRFEAFEWKFYPFERDSKHSNSNPNHSKGIRNTRMRIRIIYFGEHLKHSKHSNANMNHSKGFRSIPMQIRTIRKAFEAFRCKFEPFERDLKHSNANSKRIRTIRMQIRTIRKVSKRSNTNSNHSKGIRSIWMQIWTILKGFKVFKCKF